MKIFRFTEPTDQVYAGAGRLGTWVPAASSVCPECGASRQKRAQPLVMVWEPGSDALGDFTWPRAGSEIVVTESIVKSLSRFGGFEAGPVEMTDEPSGHGVEPDLVAETRRQPRVKLPYAGLALHELWVTSWVHFDANRSSADLQRKCGTCGTEFWEVYGVERRDWSWDPDRGELVWEQIPKSGPGVVVREEDLGEAGIFRVHELPSWIFCTEEVRDFIQKEGFSNVFFLEMGQTV